MDLPVYMPNSTPEEHNVRGSQENSSHNNSRLGKSFKLGQRKLAHSPKKVSMTQKLATQRKREEERVKKILMNHVPENKKTQAMVTLLVERLKTYKIAIFDYSDDYSREWFKTIYHLNRNLKLNKLNITGDMMLAYLRKVSSQHSPSSCSNLTLIVFDRNTPN